MMGRAVGAVGLKMAKLQVAVGTAATFCGMAIGTTAAT